MGRIRKLSDTYTTLAVRSLRQLVCRIFDHDLLPLPSHIRRRGTVIEILCLRCDAAVVWE